MRCSQRLIILLLIYCFVIEHSGVDLPLSRAPKELLQMSVPGERSILTSAIASDASRIAYINDKNTLKLYHLETVRLFRIPFLGGYKIANRLTVRLYHLVTLNL